MDKEQLDKEQLCNFSTDCRVLWRILYVSSQGNHTVIYRPIYWCLLKLPLPLRYILLFKLFLYHYLHSLTNHYTIVQFLHIQLVSFWNLVTSVYSSWKYVLVPDQKAVSFKAKNLLSFLYKNYILLPFVTNSSMFFRLWLWISSGLYHFLISFPINMIMYFA